jgi:leader peptidase (prepilin peptidase)/N-methyltransferase
MNQDFQFVLVLLYVTALGAIIGSFLNVCIHRFRYGYECLKCGKEFGTLASIPVIGYLLSRGKCSACGEPRITVVNPPSFCPKCKHPISWYDNVPLLSYIILGGKCRHCKVPISFMYVAVEFAVVCFFLVINMKFEPFAQSYQSPGFWSNMGVTVLCAYFGCSLLVASIIDIRLQIIPEGLVKLGVLVGVVGSALVPQLHTERYLESMTYSNYYSFAKDLGALTGNNKLLELLRQHPWADGLLCSLGGIAVGAGVCWLILWGFTRIFAVVGTLKKYGEKTAMGYGDVYLMAFIGAFLGWKGAILTFFLAPIFGTIISVPLYILGRIKQEEEKEARRQGRPTGNDASTGTPQTIEEKLDDKYGFTQSKLGVVPFGPFLSAAALLVFFYEFDILRYLNILE